MSKELSEDGKVDVKIDSLPVGEEEVQEDEQETAANASDISSDSEEEKSESEDVKSIVSVEDEDIPENYTLIYEARRIDGSIMGLVVSKTLFTLVLAIAETDKKVKIKSPEGLE